MYVFSDFGNLLRYHMRDEVSIDELIGVGNRIAILLLCLIRNRWDFIKPMTPNSNTFWLPIDESAKTLATQECCVVPVGSPRVLGDYSLKM